MLRKQLLKDISIGLLFLLIVFIVFLYLKKDYAERAEEEIQYVKDQIALDLFSQSDIASLSTQPAQDFAETALADYEIMKENYPDPLLTIITPYETEVAQRESFDLDWNLITEDYTKYTANTGSDSSEFILQFFVETLDVEESERFTSTVSVDTGYSSKGDLIPTHDENGVYSYTLDLMGQETSVRIVAKNKYDKEAQIDLVVVRDENQEEKDRRLASEQAKREWDSSRAGQLCNQYPEWTESECTKVANGKIWIGMSYEMLTAQIGKPNSATPSNYGYGTQWQWCWWYKEPSCFYDDNDDGLVDSYN